MVIIIILLQKTQIYKRGDGFLKGKLQKAFERQQLVTIIYISKLGEITKRRLKILEIRDDKFRAYCYKKYAQRTFFIDQVLAVEPVIQKENEII